MYIFILGSKIIMAIVLYLAISQKKMALPKRGNIEHTLSAGHAGNGS